MIIKIALLSALVTFVTWKLRVKRNWRKIRNYRIAEAAGRLRLREGI